MTKIHTLLALTAGLAAAVPLGILAHVANPETQARTRDYAHAQDTPFGRAADPTKASRVVNVAMDDTMRYTPDRIIVKRGETVRFVVINRGKQTHEMVLGTRRDLEEHAKMMRKHPDMEHDEPHMLHVAPGKTSEMGWRFTKAGEFFYGCLLPGHFEAGMVGNVRVVEK
jgi:uncharacterized cupredoxin-like copper-binding protein